MIEQPKKERRFLKALGRVGEILIQEVLIKIGSNLIKKIGGKKTLPSILFLLASLTLFAQYPATGNKQRLGYQTTGDGLVFRGRASDTTALKPSTINNAYFVLDTVNNVLYNYIITKGGWQFSNADTIIINNNFTQPFDSLFFKTSVSTNNVDTAKMRWDSDLGTVVLGMYDKVPNELGFKNFWLVKNQTGSTITKGSIVYANGTVGASGRISVAKFIADGSIDAKYLLGITAHDLGNGEDGYVISFGKIRQVNTDTFAAGSILYPSPTTAGVWTDVEPVAPNIDMPIGFCINSSSNNGTIAIRVASGYKLSELHDVAILSPVENSSLYYKSGLWRDTTAALLVSDTALMLTPYLRKLDTISLSNRINLKLNISDTASMLTPYFKDSDTTSLNLTSRFAAKLNISDTATMLTNYLRSGVAASTYQAKLNGTGFVKASGTTITYDNSTYLTTGTAASTYLPLTGGTLTGDLYAKYLNTFAKTTYVPFNVGIGEQSIYNVGTALRGGTVMVFPDSTITGSSANVFLANSSGQGDEFSAMGSGIRNYTKQGGDNRRNSLALYTSGIGSQNTNRLFIDYDGNIGINDDTPSYKLEVNGTFGATGATTLSAPLTVNSSAVFNEGSTDSDFRVESDGNANMLFVDASTDRVGIGTSTPSKTLEVNGEVKINTTSVTPTVLLGKDANNVVGQLYIDGGLSIVGNNLFGINPSFTSTTSTSVIYASGYMNTVSSLYIKITQNSTVTITLPSATGNNGRLISIKNLGTGAVISNSSNVEPFNSSTLGTAILPSGGGKWANLVSDGTNWVIMSAN